MLRRVPLEKVENFRDLGGYYASYGETSFGILYRSGTLSDATEKDLNTIASLGIRSVIDLRADADKEKYPDKTMKDPRFREYLLPVNGNGRVPVNKKDQIESYLEMLSDPKKDKAVFHTLAVCPKPCVIHCVAGKDRTGVFCMMILLANGVPFHDVNADYMLSFPYLSRMTRETKKKYPNGPKVIYTPDTFFLKKVMTEFNERFGTIHDYFLRIGLSKKDIDTLEHLLEKK
jgi:protein-tyrosine phosphatase